MRKPQKHEEQRTTTNKTYDETTESASNPFFLAGFMCFLPSCLVCPLGQVITCQTCLSGPAKAGDGIQLFSMPCASGSSVSFQLCPVNLGSSQPSGSLALWLFSV